MILDFRLAYHARARRAVDRSFSVATVFADVPMDVLETTSVECPSVATVLTRRGDREYRMVGGRLSTRMRGRGSGDGERARMGRYARNAYRDGRLRLRATGRAVDERDLSVEVRPAPERWRVRTRANQVERLAEVVAGLAMVDGRAWVAVDHALVLSNARDDDRCPVVIGVRAPPGRDTPECIGTFSLAEFGLAREFAAVTRSGNALSRGGVRDILVLRPDLLADRDFPKEGLRYVAHVIAQGVLVDEVVGDILDGMAGGEVVARGAEAVVGREAERAVVDALSSDADGDRLAAALALVDRNSLRPWIADYRDHAILNWSLARDFRERRDVALDAEVDFVHRWGSGNLAPDDEGPGPSCLRRRED